MPPFDLFLPCGLQAEDIESYDWRMSKFVTAIVVWLVMGAIITAGIVIAASKGSFWLLAVGLVCFIVAVGKIGCATH